MIKINNVNHFYKKKQILKDFSLNINSNSVTSILGPSGSGKTTLLRLISGLENLQSGNIQIDNNNDISSSKINNQMNNVSFVFQDSALFPHLTVIENIYYGLSKLGGECAVKMYKNSLILRITMTEKPFLFKKAYSDLVTNFMFHEDVAKSLFKLINKKGIINVGGKIQSVFNFARKYNPKIKKISARRNLGKNYPLNPSMNVNKYKKIIK